MEKSRLPLPTQPVSTVKTLLFFTEPAALPRFDDLLQTGFIVTTLMELSVRAYLSGELGLPNRYIDTRVTTIFLDGKPVDNIDSAVIREGCTLALSSAMPGLVGATMRRDSHYASLRNTISYRAPDRSGLPVQGPFRIKLFNLLLKELGPVFLERGICVPLSELAGFLARQPAGFFRALKKVTLEGKEIEASSLVQPGRLNTDELVYVAVSTQNDDKNRRG